jgi:magnesium transporter
MRLMDAAIFAPDAAVILVRDNAVVLRIEHVRLIVTADEVLLPQDGAVGDAAGAIRFGAALLDAILDAVAENRARAGGGSDGGRGGRPPPAVSAAPPTHEPDPLPFELVVLEAALREVAASATTAVKELESVATPALDALTKTVSTPNLERVRKIKTRHQRVLARVQSLREELQGFLDDDADMFRMCLTRRADAERAAVAAASGDRGDRAPPDLGRASIYGSSIGRRPSLTFGGTPGGRLGTPVPGAGGGAATTNDDDDGDAEALETVENLLESYFMQVDAAYDRLVSMDEFIKDTEEYINIELDSARNRLIRLEISVTAGTFGLGIWSLVAGILGENLVIPEPVTKTVGGFVAINVSAALAAAAAFAGIMGYIKYMRLM